MLSSLCFFSSYLVPNIFTALLVLQVSSALQNGNTIPAPSRYPGGAASPPTNIFEAGSSCKIFNKYPTLKSESVNWAFENNIDSKHALTHSLFREVASHLRSKTSSNGSRVACLPFLIQHEIHDDRDMDDMEDMNMPLVEFTSDDLKSALASDYLDACTGKSRSAAGGSTSGNSASTPSNVHGGWRMEGLGSTSTTKNSGGVTNDVRSNNRHSFQSNRLHWDSVLDAQNTVVFNSAGAHMSSQLAPTSLAALHGLNGAAAGICLNLYVTKSDILQSAPPHTDKQDVVVIQTQGRKRWRVYSPLDSSKKFHVDPFCRGKGDDGLSVQMLSDEGSELLLDVTLSPGDVLFVPARFPHTTDTLDCYAAEDEQADDEDKYSQNSNNASRSGNHPYAERKSSMHLTLGLDTHVWAMNYMSMRTLALRRFGVHDSLLDPIDLFESHRNMEHCVGKVNRLSHDLREGLFSSLDFHENGCDNTISHARTDTNAAMAENLLAFHERIRLECKEAYGDNNNSDASICNHPNQHSSLTLEQCFETVLHFKNIWQKIEQTHESMYNAAVREERTRIAEGVGWATNVGDTMIQNRADRLSIFRVPVFFEELDKLREELRAWGDHREDHADTDNDVIMGEINLFDGDQVEAYFVNDANAEAQTITNTDTSTSTNSRTITNTNAQNFLEYSYDHTATTKAEQQQGSWTSAKVVKVRADGLFNLQLFDGTIENGIRRIDIKGPHGLGIFI